MLFPVFIHPFHKHLLKMGLTVLKPNYVKL